MVSRVEHLSDKTCLHGYIVTLANYVCVPREAVGDWHPVTVAFITPAYIICVCFASYEPSTPGIFLDGLTTPSGSPVTTRLFSTFADVRRQRVICSANGRA